MEFSNNQTIYDDKKKEIMKYYDEMNNVVSFHKKNFTKLLQDLNKSNYVGDVMNQSVDDFMASIFPKFKEFKEKLLPKAKNKLQFSELAGLESTSWF